MKKDQSTFESLTVFLLAANETDSLEQIVSKLQNICHQDDLKEIVIILKDEHCLSARTAQRLSSEEHKIPIRYFVQKKKGVPNAMLCCHVLCQTTHMVIMSSDGEMNVDNIPVFIEYAKKFPNNIISASKWHKDSVTNGYRKIRKFFSRLVSSAVGMMFGVSLTDIFTIFRIYPTSLFKLLNYSNSDFFGVEFLVLPLRVGVKTQEISTHWQPRENKRVANLKSDVRYTLFFLSGAVRIRFTPLKKFISDREELNKFIS